MTSTAAAAMTIVPCHATSARIDPGLYGQFIEYVGDLIPGLWAERLCDLNFEGIQGWHEHFIIETDDRERAWYPSGQVNRAVCRRDTSERVSGRQSMQITTVGTTSMTVGISQDGVCVTKGEVLHFSGFFKGTVRAHLVTVQLSTRERVIAEAQINISEGWAKYQVVLKPMESSDLATLTMSFSGPGLLWIDNVSLMPADSLGGWRRDVVSAIAALRPTIIRFGGNAVDMMSGHGHCGSQMCTDPPRGWHWLDGIGDVDRRTPFWAWGVLQPCAAGIEEILHFISLVGAEAMMCVRAQGSTPEQAAEQVEYFNGAVETPMGRMRATNGHPEPYGIRYWQVGNELSGTAYAAALPDFCRAMRARDPAIILLASYPSADVVATAGTLVDYICPHHYAISDFAATTRDLSANRQLCEASPGERLKLAVTEWAATSAWGVTRGRGMTLENALETARYRNLLLRNCDIVGLANRSNLANSLATGLIQTDARGIVLTPGYHVDRLYRALAGDHLLEISGCADVDLDICATYGADAPDATLEVASTDGPQSAVTIFAVNPTIRNLAACWDVSRFDQLDASVSIWTLGDCLDAGEPDVLNTFREPTRVAPSQVQKPIIQGVIQHLCPRLSVTVLRCVHRLSHAH